MSASFDRIGKIYVLSSTMISAAMILVIMVFLAINSWEAIAKVGWQFFTLEWNPSKEKFGILPMIYGSAAVTLIALVIAIPLGLLTAIFTSEILPSKYRLYVKSILELLSGIPSIIYGLIGVVFLGVWMEKLFDLQSGRTILTAGLLLAIMVLPTIIALSDEALHNVPQKYREAAGSLGLTHYEIVKSAVLPAARSDILGAVLLALGRALGETMAVMLVIGSIDKIPRSLFNFLAPGQTITSKLGREIAETAFGSLHFSAMICMALILLVIGLLLTTIALMYVYNPERRLHE